MKNTRAWLERLLLSPVHPFLLSIYFVFRLFVSNAHGIPWIDLLRPLLVSVLAAVAFFLLFSRLVQLRHTAAFMTSLVLLSFYIYNLVWAVLPVRKTYNLAITFASLWMLATFLLVVLVGSKVRTTPSMNTIASINLMAIILLLFPTVQISVIGISGLLFPPPKVHHAIKGALPSSPPDIYYIILDSYPRADVLRDIYGYDNSEFLQSLKDLGFYVAECSQSNYTSTGPSLTSSLNLDYLQNLSDAFQPNQVDLLGLFKYLDENAVQESVSDMGYQTISFASGFLWAEWRDADVFLAPPDGPMTEFETVLLHASYARILDDARVVNYDDKYAERFRRRTWLVLDSFDQLASTPGPKFAFIHLIVPHSPFAFDENGNPVAPDQADPKYGYLDQVKFINKFILPGLKMLVEKSTTPPVIILQGDHGPLLPNEHAARMKILNAYYLPNGREALYPSISPVNSFRVVFNSYFGTKFPLLEDVSYYSEKPRRFDYSILPNTCP